MASWAKCQLKKGRCENHIIVLGGGELRKRNSLVWSQETMDSNSALA